jgi:hypothetical protein
MSLGTSKVIYESYDFLLLNTQSTLQADTAFYWLECLLNT